MEITVNSLPDLILNVFYENRPAGLSSNGKLPSDIRSFLQLETTAMRRFSKVEGWIIGDGAHFLHTSSSGMVYGHAELGEDGIVLCEEMTCPIGSPNYEEVLMEKASTLVHPILLKSQARAKAELASRLIHQPDEIVSKPVEGLAEFEKGLSELVGGIVISSRPKMEGKDNLEHCLSAACDLLYDAYLNQMLLLGAEKLQDASLIQYANCTTKFFTREQVDQVMDYADRCGVLLEDYRPAFQKIRALPESRDDKQTLCTHIEADHNFQREIEKQFPDKKSYIRIQLAKRIASCLHPKRDGHKPYGAIDEKIHLNDIRAELIKQQERKSSVSDEATPLMEIPTQLPAETESDADADPETKPDAETKKDASKIQVNSKNSIARLEADRLKSTLGRFSSDKKGR